MLRFVALSGGVALCLSGATCWMNFCAYAPDGAVAGMNT